MRHWGAARVREHATFHQYPYVVSCVFMEFRRVAVLGVQGWHVRPLHPSSRPCLT